LEEETNMPTYNLFETIHNIWFQKFGNMGTCLFTITSNDYVQAFKQSLLYYAFLQGSAFGTSPDKNELHLHRANQSWDPIQIVTTIPKYISSFGRLLI
jgi:hypothetical protein